MDGEELSTDKGKLKEEIIDILKKQNYISELSECPLTTLKFLLRIGNAHLDGPAIYSALCELEEESKVIKGFERITSNLSIKINTSRWYLKQ
ncbi:hypothetical protein ACJDU8_22110 [Clostridium sp. WILCCON 0269]|uniref:Uncharacterized protein n=1 Tax=Candidatus Clostridium eludens TaxID=3381663 RepID=A0ABW8SSU3_9CLOT